MICASHMMVYCQIPPPTLVGDSILCVLVFKDRLINFHVGPSLPTLSTSPGMPGAFGPL